MEDLISTLACYTGINGPQPALDYRLNLADVGIDFFRQITSYLGQWLPPRWSGRNYPSGVIEIIQPSQGLNIKRGDVLITLAEEIRHGSQYWSNRFTNVPSCASLTGETAEHDAKTYAKQWMDNTRTFRPLAFTEMTGMNKSVNDQMVEYMARSPNKMRQPIDCPDGSASAMVVGNFGCLDPYVAVHL